MIKQIAQFRDAKIVMGPLDGNGQDDQGNYDDSAPAPAKAVAAVAEGQRLAA